MIINKSANLTKPLLKGGFDIKTYSSATTVIENTGVPKPKTTTPVYSMAKDPNIH